MTTTIQLMNWCTAHGYQLAAISQKGNHMTFLSALPLWALILGTVVGLYVGRVGLGATLSTLKLDYARIRNLFGGSKTQTVAVTQVSPQAATPVVPVQPSS